MDRMLGGACFVSGGTSVTPPSFPLLVLDAPPLGNGEGLCETWHSSQPLKDGRHGAIHYRESSDLLFGCLAVKEPVAQGTELQGITEAAYREIFDLLVHRGFNSVLRFWSYFPGINLETCGMERYRQFNFGRQEAFLATGHAVIGNVPAACALGLASGDLNVAFLAVRAEVTGIENPRQLSAYLYPSQYGPRSPTFSRAGLVRLDGRDMLFVSGTASIVGHQTLHQGDVVAQTRESMTNIAAVVAEARRLAPGADFDLPSLCYKVYVRHPETFPEVRQELERFVGAAVMAVYVQADVCRSDLLVEIEASGGHATLFS